MFSKIPFVSFALIPLTPRARTCVPLRSLCRPTATFQPSSSCNTKTYRLPSRSRILARSTWSPFDSPLCGKARLLDLSLNEAPIPKPVDLQLRSKLLRNSSDSSFDGNFVAPFFPKSPGGRVAGAEPELAPNACRWGHHTSTSFKVHALTSHSRWGTPLTSSSMKRPSVVIRKTRPSVTEPTPETNWAMGNLVKVLLKEYTAFSTILSGSLLWYGPRRDGGGVVRLVEYEGA